MKILYSIVAVLNLLAIIMSVAFNTLSYLNLLNAFFFGYFTFRVFHME